MDRMGMKDLDRVFTAEELAGGDVMFAATGVTNGGFLRGVRFTGGGATAHSVVMRSRTGTVRYIETIHHLKQKANYGW
jgi:fructose-1,6-bisphosphatase II